MWSNLLSGAIGSVVGSMLGVLGAFFLAVETVRRTQRHERVLVRDQAGVMAAGEIANALVAFYDALTELVNAFADKTMEQHVSIKPAIGDLLWSSMRDLSRTITIQGTLLPRELDDEIGRARDQVREVFGVSGKDSVRKESLVELRSKLRAVTDSLRHYRRESHLVKDAA